MGEDVPADTAGPSSPPPRLPEGWLPQWEGVGRQWYYVQRATGKSQWEIPTEPVIMTPSSTPGDIGAGPSQAPPGQTADRNQCPTVVQTSMEYLVKPVSDPANNISFASSDSNGQLGNQNHDQANTTARASKINELQGYPLHGQEVPPSHRNQAASLPQIAANTAPAFGGYKWEQNGLQGSQHTTFDHYMPSHAYPDKPTSDLSPRNYSNVRFDERQFASMPESIPLTLPSYHTRSHREKSLTGLEWTQSAGQGGQQYLAVDHEAGLPFESSFLAQPPRVHQVPDPYQVGAVAGYQTAPFYPTLKSNVANNHHHIHLLQNSLSGSAHCLSARDSQGLDGPAFHQFPAPEDPTRQPFTQSPFHYSSQQPSDSVQHEMSTNRVAEPAVPNLDAASLSASIRGQESAHGYQNPVLQASLRHYLPAHAQHDSNNRKLARQSTNNTQLDQYNHSHQGQNATSSGPSRASNSDPQFYESGTFIDETINDFAEHGSFMASDTARAGHFFLDPNA
ncbi:hypothetical protein N7539_002158 [Penicillium diatomitis]|uniref:WW domain-containing protein n=1 Tax=Penicillium diatomitis TaxID=2819901 RepID=A0A9W9XI52_9EURO|nr:uncharacterized protein N7539_002158 [Penicillium diatomitis]KAJ5493412.1 hypothetical protein N7539_002158 [Penicillium diatomitis]